MNDRNSIHNRTRRQGTEKPNDNRLPFNKSRINLAADNLPPTLFSQVAEDAAKDVANERDKPKPTQLRKFYDEICMWDSKSQLTPDRFNEYMPFILMLKAKAAYAKGRNHVNKDYVDILNHCLDELEKNPNPKTLHNLKLFMEAFTGFYKVYGPSN